jgi:transposase
MSGPASTAIEPASYGHRRQNRQDFIARGRDGKFLPTGICWVVERSFSWIANYRRLNTIFDRTKEHLVAFIEIAFVSIVARRLKRLVASEINA